MGAIPIVRGEIAVENTRLSAQTVQAVRARIAFIGQEPVLGAEQVRDALLLPFSFKTHRNATPSDNRIHELIERLHLPSSILRKPCSRISGGEKQRIAIIRALLLGKCVFLADEVTSALDPASRKAVMDELFRPEITLLSISHDPEWIKGCGRIIDFTASGLQEVES
jgi:putative ABC transport system ATP-binding protein